MNRSPSRVRNHLLHRLCIGPALCLCLVLCTSPALFAGMAVMTDSQLSKVEGGDIVKIDISDPGEFYGGANNITIVRFSSDIYVENYGELGVMKMGNYVRTNAELGNLAGLGSEAPIIRYSTDYGTDLDRSPGKVRTNSGHPAPGQTTEAPYVGAVGTYINNFGLSTGPDWTEWDVNWEKVRMGGEPDNPLQVYGVIMRAEFSDFGTTNQELRRLVVGSNKLFGYSGARPLVTSGWLNSSMADLNRSIAALGDAGNAVFQLQRDCMMDQYWRISSLNFNPNDVGDHGSFRDFFFNTDLNTVNAGNGDFAGTFRMQNHGFFVSMDLTDRRYSGWNLIGGVNEYQYWPNFEDAGGNYANVISFTHNP
ncbi:hypothetical protein [Desulfosudis oleivorans]|uniref:hypothetical protein n=1 Tax=Desulfosudis oleivorans TaxID=181663 RepID=UPI00059C4DBB|nr:hypothetical protein [Desulfosudis oleivorans]